MRAAVRFVVHAVSLTEKLRVPQFIVKTLGDVAAFFDVALQTVKQWRVGADGMPGKPGAFDLAEITRWRIEREKKNNRNAPEGSRKEQLEEAKLAIDVQKRKLQYDRLAGTLVDVDAVARLLERAIHEHNAQADQLHDRIEVLLPESLTTDERERVIRGINKAVDDLRNHLADASEQWTIENANPE
jgi:hypothetical protein